MISGRSLWAIAAGVLFIVIGSTLVDIVLHIVKVYPAMDQPLTDALALLALSYRIAISIIGGWLSARLAPTEPMKHALWLGYVGIVLGMVGLVLTWDLGLGPHWYPISLVVLAVPQCWLGGRIFVANAAAR